MVTATASLSDVFSATKPMLLEGYLGPPVPEEPTEFFAVLEISGNGFAFEMREREHFREKYKDIDRIKVKLPNSQDIRETGEIRVKTIEELLKQLRVIKGVVNNLLRKNHTVYLKAIGTAAMRDAGNCDDIEQQIFDLAGITFEKVDGKDEAEFCAKGITLFYPTATGLVVDMGGGSTEFALIENGKSKKKRSLAFGTASIAAAKKAGELVDDSLDGLHRKQKNVDTLYLSGGTFRNINKALCVKEGWDIKSEEPHTVSLKDYQAFIEELIAMDESQWREQPENLIKRREFLDAALIVVKRLRKTFSDDIKTALTKTKTRDGIFRTMEEDLVAYEQTLEADMTADKEGACNPNGKRG